MRSIFKNTYGAKCTPIIHEFAKLGVPFLRLSQGGVL